ncbi:MAG: DUF1289 domain-containing protein [Gammaproteobacteria bacterium]
MSAGDSNPSRPGYPASPCNSVCTLNDSNVCVGCRRTLDEIVRWATMEAEEQWNIVSGLEARRL